MDLVALETFSAVARLGSVTAAANERSLSQPGVTRQVQRLEAAVGVPLFHRGERPLRLTEAGEQVFEFAEATLAARDALLAKVGVGRATPAPVLDGSLMIAASTTPGEFVVPGLVAAFAGRHPGVRPEVMIADSATVVAEVQAGRWEIGFVGARLGGGLRYRSIVEDEVVLAVPAGHRLAKRGACGLHELADEPFIDREGGSGTLASVHRALAKQGARLPRYRTVMVLGSSQAIVSAVAGGLGVGWVSSLALSGRESARVAAVRLAGVPLRRTLWLVDDPRRRMPAAATAFAAWVVAERRLAGSGDRG